MKKIVLAALAASAAFIAMPAAAQTVTGTVNLTGSVAPKCFVLPGNGSTFTGSVNFGELAAADGTLRTGLSGDVTAAALAFRVLCTTAHPDVTVNANPLAAATPAPAGYSNTINYNAHVAFSIVGGGTDNVSNDSTAPAATAATLSGRLNGTGTNIAITADTFRTAAASDILVADPSYTGTIVVTVAPGT